MRYKQLAQQVSDEIQQGKWPLGCRFYSLRQFANLHGISLNLAQNCYHLLESQGWLQARPKAGFFIHRAHSPQQHTPSATVFTSQIADIDLAHPPQFAHFNAATGVSHAFGVSRFSPSQFPEQAFSRSIKAALNRYQNLLHEYPDPTGEPKLRQVLSNHFAWCQHNYDAQQWVITGGCMDAVRLAIESCTQTGDRIGVSSPCFNGLLQLLVSLGRQILEIPCNDEGLDLDQLERHMAQGEIQAGLFSTSHMNPQGSSASISQKQRLAHLANQYRIPVIEDDVYHELSFHNAHAIPAKAWDQQGYILWCGSASKSLSEGMRLGWCLPGRYLSAYAQRQSVGCYGHNNLLQYALADFIASGQYHKHLQKLRPWLFRNVCDYRAFILEHFPCGTKVSLPTGGTVLWLQIPALTSARYQQYITPLGFDVRHGSLFSPQQRYQQFIRLNIGWGLDEAVDNNISAREALLQLAKACHF